MGKTMAERIRDMNDKTNKAIRHMIAVITSVPDGGKLINTKPYGDTEVRDIKIMLPYGISSSGLDNLLSQVIINIDGKSMVGVYDPGRPAVKSGELILYTKYGQTIKLLSDGNISIEPKTGCTVNIGGNKGVARVDDPVEVTVPGIGICNGKITTGSNIVKVG